MREVHPAAAAAHSQRDHAFRPGCASRPHVRPHMHLPRLPAGCAAGAPTRRAPKLMKLATLPNANAATPRRHSLKRRAGGRSRSGSGSAARLLCASFMTLVPRLIRMLPALQGARVIVVPSAGSAAGEVAAGVAGREGVGVGGRRCRVARRSSGLDTTGPPRRLTRLRNTPTSQLAMAAAGVPPCAHAAATRARLRARAALPARLTPLRSALAACGDAAEGAGAETPARARLRRRAKRGGCAAAQRVARCCHTDVKNNFGLSWPAPSSGPYLHLLPVNKRDPQSTSVVDGYPAPSTAQK